MKTAEKSGPNTEHIPLPFQKFLERSKKHSERVFFVQPMKGVNVEITWAQAADQALRIASAIKSLNLPKRSHIAIFSKNCAHWFLADLAIWLSGNVSVPLYPNLSVDTVGAIAEHSEVKAIFLGKLDRANLMMPGIPTDITRIAFPYQVFENSLLWDDLVKSNQPLLEIPPTSEDDLATIIYTSGTTGKPKGVMHSFKALSFPASKGVEILGFTEEDRFFSYLPLAHVAERLFVEMFAIYSGGKVFFADTLDSFARNIVDAKPTAFMAVPRIWSKFQSGILAKMPQKKMNLLLRVPFLSKIIKKRIREKLGFASVRRALTGAAPISSSALEWYAKLGIVIQEAYAMSENFAWSHFILPGGIKYGSVGQPLPGVTAKRSPEGEILVKSVGNMLGYYKEPELTRDAFEDGFLKTGDRGEIDSQEYLTITGRVKDLFKTAKGKYVAPSPIEMQLGKCDNLEQVCVLGAGLSQPLALATLSPVAREKTSQLLQGELEAFLKAVNSKLDPHEKLSKLVVVKENWTVENEFLTPTMKIKRNRIEQNYEPSFSAWEKEKSRVIL